MNTFKYQDKKSKNYFEGWYTRFTTSKGENYAVIFAITKHISDAHSFIQVFKENDEKCQYLRFSKESFSYDYNNDKVTIENNSLSTSSLILRTKQIDMELHFSNQEFLSKHSGSDSAMGYLKHAPLECFQEVIFLQSNMSGYINFNGTKEEINGTAYMEKTYGDNFPKRWIWLQSNHNEDGNSISFSIGKIPVLFFTIKGFFILLKINGVLHRFSTYNLSRISIKNGIIKIVRGTYKIILTPDSINPTTLVGPKKNGLMTLDVFESLGSNLKIEFYKGNKEIYKGSFTNVGSELMY